MLTKVQGKGHLYWLTQVFCWCGCLEEERQAELRVSGAGRVQLVSSPPAGRQAAQQQAGEEWWARSLIAYTCAHHVPLEQNRKITWL